MRPTSGHSFKSRRSSDLEKRGIATVPRSAEYWLKAASFSMSLRTAECCVKFTPESWQEGNHLGPVAGVDLHERRNESRCPRSAHYRRRHRRYVQSGT